MEKTPLNFPSQVDLDQIVDGQHLEHPGDVEVVRPMLAQHVWGLDFDPESNIVDVYVGYLRRKIDSEGDPRLLHTIEREA